MRDKSMLRYIYDAKIPGVSTNYKLWLFIAMQTYKELINLNNY